MATPSLSPKFKRGRGSQLTPSQRTEIQNLLVLGHSKSEVARLTGRDRETVLKVARGGFHTEEGDLFFGDPRAETVHEMQKVVSQIHSRRAVNINTERLISFQNELAYASSRPCPACGNATPPTLVSPDFLKACRKAIEHLGRFVEDAERLQRLAQ